jgi:hypothetical protein
MSIDYLFIYLKMLYQLNIFQVLKLGWFVNAVLKNLWKQAVMIYLNIWFQHLICREW